MGAVGRGFLARFALLRPPPHPGGDQWNPGKVPDDLTAEWAGAITRILNLPHAGRVLDMGDRLIRSIGQPDLRLGILHLDVPVWASIDWASAILAGGACVAMLRYRVGMLWTLAACVALGMTWSLAAR